MSAFWSLTLLFIGLTNQSPVVQATYVYVYVAPYYYYYTTYYTASAYVSIGAIIGSVIGALSFVGFVIGIIVCVCCVRKRRLAQERQLGATTMVQVPMATMGGGPTTGVATVSGGDLGYPKQDGFNYYGGGAPQIQMPPPYPMGEAGGPHVNNGYQWPAGSAPYPTAGMQQQPPYPPQQPPQQPLYPPPGYQQPQMQPPVHQNVHEQRF